MIKSNLLTDFIKNLKLRYLYKFKLLFLLANLLMTYSFAQVNVGDLFMPSPNANSLGKFGDIPVSLYTGVPGISIPIYTVAHKDLKLPVSLNYHSSGIRVQDEASWVGLGWSLDAGGVITRVVNGLDDLHVTEKNRWPAPSPYEYNGFPYDNQVADLPTDEYKLLVCQGKVDPEPDQFYFNFAGYSGSFVFKQGQDINSNYIVATGLKKENIRIVFYKPEKRWEITTPDGCKYYFTTREINERQSKYSETLFNYDVIFANYNSMSATAWYLDKIESRTGTVINLEYDTKGTGINAYSEYGSVSVPDKTDQYESIIKINSQGGSSTQCLPPSLKSSFNVNVNYTELIYLKRIYWDNGEILFTKSNRLDMLAANQGNVLPFVLTWLKYSPQKLDVITIKDNSSTQRKIFKFQYTYFNETYSGTHQEYYKRLKLDRVEMYSPTSVIPEEKYTLTYNETVSLPSKQSFARDFWGYYNGVDLNNSLVPTGTYFLTNGEKRVVGTADRFPNNNYLQAGMLTSITYPTGGSSTFTYEPNDYYFFGNSAFELTDFEKYTDPVVSVSTLSSSDDFKYFDLTVATEVTFSTVLQFNEFCRIPDTNPNPFMSPYTNNENQIYAFVVKIENGIDPTISTLNPATMNVIWTLTLGEWLNRPLTDPRNCVKTNQFKRVLSPGRYKVYTGYYPYWYSGVSATYSDPSQRTRTIKKNSSDTYAKMAGGLRISKIMNSSVQNGNTVYKYSYNVYDEVLKINRSTGRLMMFPSHHSYWNMIKNENNCQVDYEFLKGTSWSNVSLGNSAQGSSVGYDKVTVFRDENGLNGRVETIFHNTEESIASGTYIEGFPNITHPMNGMMQYEDFYDKDSNPLKSVHFIYSSQIEPIKGLRYFSSIDLWARSMGGSTELSCYDGVLTKVYNVNSTLILPDVKEETSYIINPKSSVNQTENFFYNATGLLTRKEAINSNGILEKHYYKYPIDYTPSSQITDIEALGIKGMIEKNIVSTPIEIYKETNNKIVSGNIQTYYEDNGRILPYKYYSLETDGNGIFSSSSLLNGLQFNYDPKYKLKVQYQGDTNGNVVQSQTSADEKLSIIWGYNSTFPVVKIEGIAYADIISTIKTDISNRVYTASSDYASVKVDVDYLKDRLSSLMSDSRYTVSIFTYSPLIGMTSQTDPNGVTTYYDYDSFGRLKAVKDHQGNILKSYEYHYKE